MKKLIASLALIGGTAFFMGFSYGRTVEVKDQIRYMEKLKALEDAENLEETQQYHASI